MRFPLFAQVLGVALASAAHAQAPYPERPITMVVPGPPGAGTDVPARMVVPLLAARLGQSIVVDNRAAASGTQGTLQVLAAKPDGYTLLFGNGTVLGIAPSLFPQLTIEETMRFAPVGMVGQAPMILLVPADSPIASVKQLVDSAKAQPGKLNLAHGGNGTPHHLSGEMFKQAAGVDMVSVPYKGAVAALAAIMAGQVDASFEGPSGVPMVKAGRVRALAVAGEKRHAGLPDVPLHRSREEAVRVRGRQVGVRAERAAGTVRLVRASERAGCLRVARLKVLRQQSRRRMENRHGQSQARKENPKACPPH